MQAGRYDVKLTIVKVKSNLKNLTFESDEMPRFLLRAVLPVQISKKG